MPGPVRDSSPTPINNKPTSFSHGPGISPIKVMKIVTLNVSIGKVKASRIEERPIFEIELCPKSEVNICNPEITLWPNESYLSGSIDFWDFWYCCVGKLYYRMRDHPNSNDLDVVYLKSFSEDIQSLDDNCSGDPADVDRMKWFKHWTKKAVELYDDDAGISFS